MCIRDSSRIFSFANGGSPEVYIGSADWMSRNLDRRIEAVTPIEDPEHRQKLERLLQLYLNDNQAAWDMESDGTFVQRKPENGDSERNSQMQLVKEWSNGIQSL